MQFELVPITEWQLAKRLGASRIDRLLTTRFECIVEQIVTDAIIIEARWEGSDTLVGAKRLSMTLLLPSRTVDLFHNGAGGYRAQFYLGVEHGEAGTRYVVESLLPKIRMNRRKPECGWERVEESLRHHQAKVWIHEGKWLSSDHPEDQNLVVDRWERNFRNITLAHRFEPVWARLTPDREVRLLLKGGWLDSSFETAS